MALHGSATIELTNADGSKEVIKHDNMITNAVNELLKSRRGEIATIFKHMATNDSFAQALFGGILLFGETLDNDPNKCFLPTTNIIGYASQDAYGGLDVARGSVNSSESGLQEDGSYKFVWDFATSQSNGVIKSIALCPKVMGKIGASETQVDSERVDCAEKIGTQSPFDNQGLDYSGTTDGILNYNFHIVAIIGDIAYVVNRANIYEGGGTEQFIRIGGILKLYKFKLGHSNVSVVNNVGRAYYLGYDEVQLPTNFTDQFNQSDNVTLASFYDYESSKIILCPSNKNADIQINGSVTCCDVDLSNNYATNTFTFVNNTGGFISKYGYSPLSYYRNANSIFACKDYVVVMSMTDTTTSENKMYVIKRSDKSDVKEVKYSEGNEFIITGNAKYTLFEPLFCKNNIFVFAYNTSYSNTNRSYYILDMNTGIVKKTNAKNMTPIYPVDIGSDVAYINMDSYLCCNYTMNPFILTTKNNLDSPVTKTSNQTMKITYILTESGAV